MALWLDFEIEGDCWDIEGGDHSLVSALFVEAAGDGDDFEIEGVYFIGADHKRHTPPVVISDFIALWFAQDLKRGDESRVRIAYIDRFRATDFAAEAAASRADYERDLRAA